MLRIVWMIAAWAALGWVSAAPVMAQGAIDRLKEQNDARNASIEGDADDQPGDEQAGADDESPPPAPPAKLDQWDDQYSIPRYRSPSISWWKLLLIGLTWMYWILVGEWINREVNEREFGYEKWSLVALLPGMIGGLLVLLLPVYLASIPLLVVACVVPMVAYAVMHNKQVEPHEKVFTKDWFRFVIAGALGKIGIKIKTEKQAGYLAGAPVDLIAAGGDERSMKANLLTARQSPGYVLVKDKIAEMVERGSSRMLLDYSQQGVAVKHLIDGVWHQDEPKELEDGNVLLAVMKQLANLDAKDRRSKQSGMFLAEYKGAKYACPLQSAGTKTGERVVLTVAGGNEKKFKSYDDLGMRSAVAEEWGEVMASSSGLIVFSTPPEGGLTTMINVSFGETDRLMRDFVAIEQQGKPELDIENIEQVFFDPAADETPATLMPRLIRKYPDVYVVRDFVDAESAKVLLEQAAEGKLLITSVKARDTVEALIETARRAPVKLIAQTAIGLISAKLIRLLCHECRVEFEPSPDLLKKLGIPAGKVEKLYREPKPDEIEKPCQACGGIGFKGRTALFEVLRPDDKVREALLKQPKPDVLRKLARASGMRTFQEEGILLIARGDTSLAELQRVLKG